ncbi:MAG: alpha/beta hydrolase [Rhodanobacteraceae bacterium]|jgi:pimeloyl-ACP methyl ester carboxylesterase|nr:alpha/beta hydrolase [Rhodanobacteraceae bacterium]
MRETGRPPVVCVHGAGAGGWEWSLWARVLAARGFAVLAPDLRPAAGGLAATRFEHYAAQVVAWCGGAGEAPVLVGASLGGLLALAVAAAVRPSALVLVNPVPPRGIAPPPAAPHPAIVPWGRARSLASTQRALPDADAAACLYAFRRWRDESGAVLDAARGGIAVARPDCATLVIASERDTDVPLAHSRALAASLAADFEALPGASHVAPLLGRIAPDVAARVADWLAARVA